MQTQATIAQPLPETSTALMQVSGALALVIILILAVAWLAKRTGFVHKHTAGNGLKIASSISLGGRERLVIVELENARLLLGVTASHITCLHSLPPASDNQSQSVLPAKPASDFAGMLKKLLSKPQGKP